MSWSGLGVWLAAQGSFRVLLFHASTYDQLLEINVGPAVAQKLQSLSPVDAFRSVLLLLLLFSASVSYSFRFDSASQVSPFLATKFPP